MIPVDTGQAIARALAYPYARPKQRFVFRAGEAEAWEASDIARLPGLTPVLAIGSNASPEQLRRKFGHGHHDPIPVTFGTLVDHDVVYCAYMTRYGSVPATLVDSPGTRVPVAITWLTADTLNRMHETESVGLHTEFGALCGLVLTDDAAMLPGQIPAQVFTWRSRLGELTLSQAMPIALGELAATARQWDSLSQTALQQRLQQAIEVHRDEPVALRDWVAGNLSAAARREQICAWMQKRRVDVGLKRFEAAAG